MDRQGSSALTSLGLAVLALNSGLAIYNSWGDAGSVGFVLLADAATLLLFLCLREFEQGGGGRGRGRGRDARIKAAVWVLTTLLTAMFACRVAPLMPLLVGALVLLCLRELEQAQIGGLGGGQYAELLKICFGVEVCNSALAHHHSRGGDAGSLVFVLVASTAAPAGPGSEPAH